ncbi:MAG: exodeoxyribonuclease VII small subunit [Ruminococcaceae bacterium]|nr:exodeoxyribonuclease VII small subunit [Oscillospiraceae bacterium]
MAAKKEKVLSFEESLNRLEEIANVLENESPNLSAALEMYEESAKLLKDCSEMLDEAQKKITVLSKAE